MPRKPAKPSTAPPENTPDYSPAEAPIPGLEDVLKHLEDLRCAGTTDLLVVDDELDDDKPIAQAAWEMRNTPRDLLDALLMLRLHSMLALAGLTSFRPNRGSLQVIVAPIESDRTDIRTVLPQMIGRDPALPDPAIRVDDDVTRKRTGKGVLESLRADIRQGNPVIAVMAADDMLPDDLRVAMQPTLRLPPLSRRMVEAVMTFHFDELSVALQHSDARIPQLSDVALSSIFAAEDLNTAIERLEHATSQKTHTRVTLEDVHGQPKAVKALRQVVEDLWSYQSGAVKWSEVTKSFLLLGPPGTGKTLLAEGLSGSAGIEFVKTSYSDCQRAGHQGDMLRELNAAVERAIAAAPCVFFIDEIDSFHSRSIKSNSTYIIGVVNGLLTQIDRLSATAGIILIAATNDVERVDSAVIRPGRFDRHIHVGKPDRSGIRSMLEGPLSGLKVDPVEIDRLCDQLLGSSGAEIAALIRDARTRARAERSPLSFGHLKSAADAIQPPPEPGVIWRISVHEAGHLLAGHLLRLPSATHATVTGIYGRVTRPYPTCRIPETVGDMIVHDLAGRVAERLVFGVISQGAGSGPTSDLALATRSAVAAETSYGFGTSLSWIDPETPLYLLPRDIQSRVEARLNEAETRTQRLLAERKPDIERIARVLMEKRDLDAAVNRPGFTGG